MARPNMNESRALPLASKAARYALTSVLSIAVLLAAEQMSIARQSVGRNPKTEQENHILLLMTSAAPVCAHQLSIATRLVSPICSA